MKSLQNILATALIAIVFLTSCKKDDSLGNVADIPGLGGEVWAQGSIDLWIHDSLTVPYNIAVQYKWNQFSLGELEKNVTPVKEEIVIPVMDAMKRIWIDVYKAEVGELFVKKYTPKFFVLAGSSAYGYDGTTTLGIAGGGRQIFLLQLNYFKNKTMPGYVAADTAIQVQTFHVIHHEFSHIFDQTQKRPYDFDKEGQGLYSSDWINLDDVTARKDGFITAYASSAAGEDFAEMCSMMLILGKNGFNKLVSSITGTTPSARGTTPAQARTKLNNKRDVIIAYFKNLWGIDFESLQARTRAAISAEFY